MNKQGYSERLYGFLADDEDARVCAEIPSAACNEQPRSFVLQLVALTFTKLADALASPRLVLAWMLSALGAPAVFIGLLVPLRESLALLPQLLVAQYLRERSIRKYFWAGGAVGQALALTATAAAALLFDGVLLGASVTGALACFALARGVCSLTAKDVLGKTVSRTRRGRLTGQAASAAGAVTLLVAAALLLSPQVTDSRVVFVVLLGAAALLWMVAGLVYSRIPEAAGATTGGGNAFTAALRSLGLLRDDRHFRNFVIARALLVATAFAIPYIVVLVQRSGGDGAATLGGLLLANGAAGLLGGPAWGKFSDRAANRVMAYAAALSVVTMLAVLLMRHAGWLGNELVSAGVLFFAAVAHHGARVGRKTYLVDMANSENRAQYVAVSNTAIGVVLLLGALLGWLDSAAGTGSVLVLLAVFGTFAVVQAWRLPDVSG